MIGNLVGTRIREIRASRKLTQQQLAELAGIPRPTLASMERDDSNPTLALVYKVAQALGLAVDDLIQQEFQRVRCIREGEMRRVLSGDGAYRAVTVSPENVHDFLQQVFRLRPHSLYHGKPHPPGSDEYLHILEGQVELDVAGEVVLLSQGDSARFRGNVAHSYANPAGSEAMGVVTIVTCEKNSS